LKGYERGNSKYKNYLLLQVSTLVKFLASGPRGAEPAAFENTAAKKMAIKPCRKCGEKVGLFAASCPNCGKKHPTMGLIDFLIALVLIAAVIWLSMPSNNHREALRPAAITAAPPAQPDLNIVRIMEPTIACPSPDTLMTVYRELHPNDEPEADAPKTGLVLDQYGCTLLPAGSRVRVLSNGSPATTVTVSDSAPKATPLYVRSADLLHQIGHKVFR
jgi:hypothetical protein